MFFTAECTDNRDTCQDLTCYQIQFVNQSLQYCKLRHCHLEQNNDHNKDQAYCKTKDPCHRGICLQYADHATDTKDRRIEYDTEKHCHYLLHLLNIIRTTGDQRCC